MEMMEIKEVRGKKTPGALIRDCLKERGISQKEFALRMDLSEKHISRLINAEVQLTPDVAFRLEMVLGIAAKVWNSLEAEYRDSLLREQLLEGADDEQKVAELFAYDELVSYGWIGAEESAIQRLTALRRFFEVAKLTSLREHAVLKSASKSPDLHNREDLAALAWAQAGRMAARKIPVNATNPCGLADMIPELRKMATAQPEKFCSKLQKSLAKCGIALVFIPCPKGVLQHGVTLLDGERTVIVFSTGDTDDNEFWFWLFHELGHISLGHVRQLRGTSMQDEKDAHSWARNMLISWKEFDSFKQQGDFSEQSICVFAKKQGISPGIVVGRMQHDELIKTGSMNYLKELYELEDYRTE